MEPLSPKNRKRTSEREISPRSEVSPRHHKQRCDGQSQSSHGTSGRLAPTTPKRSGSSGHPKQQVVSPRTTEKHKSKRSSEDKKRADPSGAASEPKKEKQKQKAVAPLPPPPGAKIGTGNRPVQNNYVMDYQHDAQKDKKGCSIM